MVFEGFIDYFKSHHDQIKPNPTSIEMENIRKSQTGWDRLYLMYSYDEFGQPSPQLITVYQTGISALVFGALYGGIVTSRNAHLDYLERNQEKIFETPMIAKREIQDKFTLNFGKGAFRWGWRLGLFTTTYILGTTTISTYRGKFGILEHTLGGALAGCSYKFKMGLAAIAVGTGVGAILGTIGGLLTVGVLNLTGITMDDIYLHNFNKAEERRRRNQGSAPSPLVAMHEQLSKEREELTNTPEPNKKNTV